MNGIHVGVINVRTFFAIDLDANKMVIHELAYLNITKCLLLHDMTPVARAVANADQNEFVILLRLFPRLITPRPPIDGILAVLKEVRRDGVDETVGLMRL